MKKGAILIALALLLTACTPAAPTTEATPGTEGTATEQGTPAATVKVTASFYPIADFVERIGGERVAVETMIPDGTAPHGWEPSTQDRNRLEESDLFIYNGSGFEHWVDDILPSVENKNLVVVEASQGVELLEGHDHDHDHDHEHDATEDAHDHDHDHEHDATEDAHDHDHDHEHDATEDAHDHDHDHEHDATEDTHDHDHDHEHDATEDAHDHDHDHDGGDPHTWISLRNAVVQLQNITNALKTVDPEGASYYDERFSEAKAAFDALDAETKDRFADVARKDFIVGHESFQYLARDYGLTQHGIEDVNSLGEPDPKRMSELVEMAKSTGLKTVFYDPLGSSKVAETIASEIGGQAAVLNPLEGRSDEERAQNLDYLAIQRNNLDALYKALSE